jgi:hypothetical protein
MYPNLSASAKAREAAQTREAKQLETDQALWARINERNRDSLLNHLREANANLRAERKRMV